MKKLLVLLVAFSLAMSLVGCGSSDQTKEGTTESTVTGSEDIAESESKPVRIIMREVNLGGSEAVDNQEVYDYITVKRVSSLN